MVGGFSVRNRFSRHSLPAVLALALLLPGTSFAQAPQVKDQAEYDLVQAIQKEADAAKRLELLKTWKEKYPTSDFKKNRIEAILMTYQGLNNPEGMLETAKEIVSGEPKSFLGNLWITLLTVSMNKNTPEGLSDGEKAANGLLSADKPATVTDADWPKQQSYAAFNSARTLGWIAWQKKAYTDAEASFTKALTITPASAEISYWLGSVIVAQKDAEKQGKALWHFARAAGLEGDGAFQGAQKDRTKAYFEKNYLAVREGKDGMDELTAKAKAEPMPPADFRVVSISIEEEEKMAKLKDSDPKLYLWLTLKKELRGDAGAGYFKDNLVGRSLPALKGRFLGTKDNDVLISASGGDVADVAFRFPGAVTTTVAPGEMVEFEGAVPESYEKDPFMMVASIEKEKLPSLGLNVAAAAPVKGAKAAAKGAGKKAAGKKKR
jgi:hypothetical protein